jgi:hypothetical protein
MFEILDSAEEGEEFITTLPAGRYYVGDPCYILHGEGEYDAMLKKRHEGPKKRRNVHLTKNGKHLLVWDTLRGDGRFPLCTDLEHKEPLLGLGVDSGQLAIIDQRLCPDGPTRVSEKLKAPEIMRDIVGSVVFEKPMHLCVSRDAEVVDEEGLLSVGGGE